MELFSATIIPTSTTKRWIREGHALEDVELLARLVRRGVVTVEEAKDIVEKGTYEFQFDHSDHFVDDGLLTHKERNQIVKSFSTPYFDKREQVGRLEVIPSDDAALTLKSGEYISDQFERSTTLVVLRNDRPIASLYFVLNGYQQLKITESSVVKRESEPKMQIVLMSELLRRYPTVKQITWERSASILKRESALPVRDVIVQLQSNYNELASTLGFGPVEFKRTFFRVDEDRYLEYHFTIRRP